MAQHPQKKSCSGCKSKGEGALSPHPGEPPLPASLSLSLFLPCLEGGPGAKVGAVCPSSPAPSRRQRRLQKVSGPAAAPLASAGATGGKAPPEAPFPPGGGCFWLLQLLFPNADGNLDFIPSQHPQIDPSGGTRNPNPVERPPLTRKDPSPKEGISSWEISP